MGAVMQPTGQEVSREGYDDVRRSGRAGRQQQLVMRTLYIYGPSTRQDLAERTGLALASICPRCHELMDAGHVEVVGTVGKPARQQLGLSDEMLAEMPADAGGDQ